MSRLKNKLSLTKDFQIYQQDIEDAYSTIATGIEYLMSSEPEKLPFNLGGRFRNHSIDYEKVLKHTFSDLKTKYDHNDNIERISKELDKIMATTNSLDEGEMELNLEDNTSSICTKVRILHLSDFHIKEDNANNELLLKRLEQIPNIDILIITGDLRQYNTSYEASLKILKRLTKALNLEPKDVFLVPGNHDGNDFDNKENIISGIREKIYSDEEAYKPHLTELYTAFSSYDQFILDFYGKDYIANGDTHNRINIWNNSLQFLRINSALMCDKNSDASKIVDILEISQLKRLIQDIPVLCISHHSLNHLYIDHQSTMKAVFKNLKVSAMFSGDEHKMRKDFYDINERNKIPNFVVGKTLGDTQDAWSDRGIAIYTLNLQEKNFYAESYMWHNKSLKPDSTFAREPEELSAKIEPEFLPLL